MIGVLEALWLFLPAGVANAVPVLANRVPLLNRWKTPMDFGGSYRGKRITGNNKTWRGVVLGVFAAGVTGSLQAALTHRSEPLAIWFFIGAIMGFGALYGDAVESFLKRQLGVPAGHSWFPFDQIDYIIGALIAVAPLRLFSLSEMATILVSYFGLHLVVAYMAYLLKLKDRPI